MIALFAAALAVASPATDVHLGFGQGLADMPPIRVAPNSKFIVSFYNGANKPIVLLGENCSWGHEMLSFDITTPDGRVITITRKEQSWLKNIPIPIVVNPGNTMLRKIDFGDGTWEGLPAGVAGRVDGWRLRVKMNVQEDGLLRKEGFWIGKTQSPWLDVQAEG